MTYISEKPNEHGTGTSHHVCETCGVEYTVTPAMKTGRMAEVCLAENCASYDAHCDVEPLFMTDQEISDEKKVVSIDVLRRRANKNPSVDSKAKNDA